MNAHDQHAAAASKDTQSPADADAGVGKKPLVPGDATATAASQHHSVDFYQKRVGQFMSDLFSVKHDAITTFGPALTKSSVPASSFLGEALKFAIGAAGGPFVDALEIGVIAGTIIKAAIPAFADQVGKSVAGASAGDNAVDTSTFLTVYAHAVKTHFSTVSQRMESAIHNEEDGKNITGALHGKVDAGRLHLTDAQAGRVAVQTHLEALDAWTVAMQKLGDKKDHNKQGYSDPSTGQLHLDSLLLRMNNTIVATRSRQARMEGVGNDAAQLDGARRLEDIPVQRTMNVTWETGGNLTGQFGMSISASGHMAQDELGHDDKAAIAMFYDHKSLESPPTPEDFKKDEPIINRDYPKGLHKIWNTIKAQTPHQLGFSMKGD